MIADTKKKRVLRFAAFLLLAAMLLTSCASAGRSTTVSQLQLGQKYLSEMNYSEAIAAFTEAIRLDPNDIEAYFERAQAYTALKKYDEANADYTAVIEKADDQPYLQASAYVGRAGVGEETDKLADAESDYAAALVLLGDETAGKDSSTDADKVLTLKKETLAKHAAVCVTLALLDKAAGLQRRAGFEAAVKDAGLPVRPQRMAVAKFSTASGYEQAARLLGSDPRIDCLFCATDAIALGAMQYCREAGIRIPEDVMIAAVGDSSVGRNTFVPLTSAHLHYKTSGRDAAALLMDLLNDPHTVPRSQMLGYELICRESTGD